MPFERSASYDERLNMRRTLLVMMLSLCFALSMARAQEAPAASHHGSSAAEGHDNAAAEQPGILSLIPDLMIWTVIVFLGLLYVLKRYAWKPMLDGLQRREQNIHAAMEEAQRARDEAQKMQAQFQAQMNQAAERVREMMDVARRDAQQLNDEMVAKAKSEITAERDRLRREIEAARDQALSEIWSQTAQLATQISAKAIRRGLSEDDHRRLVDEALGELTAAVGKRGNGR
jgi:F-type H+-transporting ATPase subunit b